MKAASLFLNEPISQVNTNIPFGGITGTYTPTATGLSNVTSASPNQANYVKNGNIVTVTGTMGIQPTLAVTFTSLKITLPFPSTFVSTLEASGVAVSGIGTAGNIYAGSGVDVVTIQFTPATTSNLFWGYSFSYEIV